MSGNFSAHYVAVYDLLYGNKNYSDESEFVLGKLKGACRDSVTSLLDIGSGTGKHAHQFAGHGIEVTGIDLSREMVALACDRSSNLSTTSSVRFVPGDVRHFDLYKRFDAAAALFHVFSYLTEPNDLEISLRNIRKHLRVGGAFLFDYWFADAIRRDGVSRREREVENEYWHVSRLTEPVWEPENDLVRVNFHVTATDKMSSTVHRWHEEHLMRYFDPLFLEEKLSVCGFKIVEHGEWLSEDPPNADQLGAYTTAIAV